MKNEKPEVVSSFETNYAKAPQRQNNSNPLRINSHNITFFSSFVFRHPRRTDWTAPHLSRLYNIPRAPDLRITIHKNNNISCTSKLIPTPRLALQHTRRELFLFSNFLTTMPVIPRAQDENDSVAPSLRHFLNHCWILRECEELMSFAVPTKSFVVLLLIMEIIYEVVVKVYWIYDDYWEITF